MSPLCIILGYLTLIIVLVIIAYVISCLVISKMAKPIIDIAETWESVGPTGIGIDNQWPQSPK